MPLCLRALTGLVSSLALLASVIVTSTVPARAGEEPEATSGTEYGRMLLVLDSSGSMAEAAGGGQSKMQAAKRALGQVVDDLPEESAVGLRVYGAEVFRKGQPGACRDSQLVVDPGTDNRQELRQAIRGFKPYGETPIAHALQEAAKDLGGEGKRSVVLVSDGIATCQPDPCSVAADLAADGVDLQVDVIGLGVEGSARDQLRCIADRGNGTYYNVDTAEEIVDTLTRVSVRAARPFTLTGTPVEGGATLEEAPTITAGQWTDHLGVAGDPDGVRHFRVERRIPDSSVHVAATTRGTPGRGDRVRIVVTDELGAECDEEQDNRMVDKYSVLSPQVVASADSMFPEDTCWQGDAVHVMVEREGAPDTTRVPFALTVFEEPPVTNADHLPEWDDEAQYVAPRVSGRAHPLVAGTSFADAPRVDSGLYALDIVPGESQVVKVPLTWGQRFTARAVFPAGTPGVQELTGVQGPFADIKIYSSLTGATSGAYSGTNSTAILPGSGPAELTAMTPSVRYLNRTASGNTAYLPGDHFLVISANEDLQGDSWVQPYKLAIEVLGEEAGVPAYADGATVVQPLEELDGQAADPAAGADPTPAEEAPTDGAGQGNGEPRAAAPEGGDEDGWGLGTMVLVSALVVALLGAFAVIVYLLRRRGGQTG